VKPGKEQFGGRLQLGGKKQGGEDLLCTCKGEDGMWMWGGDENKEC
jgi:hypothetical protein